jgi:hypothetical protein
VPHRNWAVWQSCWPVGGKNGAFSIICQQQS